jgi:hypothetical protein
MANAASFTEALKPKTQIHTGRVRLTAFNASHIDAVDTFIQLFDAASTGDVTLGTTTPNAVLSLPAGNGTLRSHVYEPLGGQDGMGVAFTLGMVAAVTTTVSGNTAVTTAIPITFYLS